MSADNSNNTVTIIQITDSHLFQTADGRLLGMNTQDSLKEVIKKIQLDIDNVDLILATGDISQDGSLRSYKEFARLVNGMGVSSYWLPGNHDEFRVMAQLFAGKTNLYKKITTGNWQIIMLNSTVPGKVFGQLSQAELNFLNTSLKNAERPNVLVCLHHHPVPVNSAWIDQIGLRNAEALFETLANYDSIRAIACGHIHQEYDQVHDGIRVLASPSTCVQFSPGSETFQADESAPGYRVFRLGADGQIDTFVERVTHIDFEIDYSVKGY